MILFIICLAVLALLAQKLLLGRDLDQIEGEHRPTVRVAEPEEALAVEVTLKNKSRRFVPFLRVRENFAPEIVPQEGIGTISHDGRDVYHVEFTTWLRPRQSVKRAIPVSIARRGRYVLSQFKLSGGDFLGLEERSKDCGKFHEIVVAPKELPMEQLNEMFGGFMGDVSANRFILEDPVLTLGYREYTGREPMKMISWSQSARTGNLMVKKYDYTLEPSVMVVLNVDAGAAEQEETLETCFSLARTVCAMLEEQGVKYDFTSNALLAGIHSDPGAAGEGLGQRHFYGILEHLGRATYGHSISMKQLLEKESNRGSTAGRILITPGLELEDSRAMNRLREAAGGSLLVIRASEVGTWQ